MTVITRKAFGGAYDVIASKHVGGDLNYAWPTAQIAVMGAKGAVEIIFRADIGDPKKIGGTGRKNTNLCVAAERGYIDDVIMPHSTRRRIARALAMLRNKHVEMPARGTTTCRFNDVQVAFLSLRAVIAAPLSERNSIIGIRPTILPWAIRVFKCKKAWRF